MNVRSLRKKVDELKLLTDEYLFDIITLSETWLDSSVENTLLALDGYNLYRRDRLLYLASGREKRGGGFAMYIKYKCLVDGDKYSIVLKSLRN